GNLQLEDLKKINPDLLKRANMTPEEFEKFKKAYADLLKREAARPSEKEALANPLKDNRRLPNQRVRQADTGLGTKPDTVDGLAPASPPPEFREAYQEFSRRLSEKERTKEQK